MITDRALVNVFSVHRIQNLLEQMAQKVESLECQLGSLSLSTPPSSQVNSGIRETQGISEHSLTEEERNRSYLQSMDVGKVSRVCSLMYSC